MASNKVLGAIIRIGVEQVSAVQTGAGARGAGDGGCPSPDSAYSNAFFFEESKSSMAAAEVIVPMLLSVVRPRSVVDVGCGAGAFLREFQRVGVHDLLGIEGPWIQSNALLIDSGVILSRDLREIVSLDRTFDLAVCFEVAEHLPRTSADTLVDSLTRLAPVIAFSAAIPLQGGTSHLNEQWPDYWAKKFVAHGFVPIDCLRHPLLANSDVPEHYVQTSMLFVLASYAARDQRFSKFTPTDPSRVGVLICVRRRPLTSKLLNRLPPALRQRVYYLGRRFTTRSLGVPPA